MDLLDLMVFLVKMEFLAVLVFVASLEIQALEVDLDS